MNKKITNLREDISNLTEVNNDIIQCRYISKNFIKNFKQYLTKEDFDKIEKDPDSKGQIITKRLGILFDNKNRRKLFHVQNLIGNVWDLVKKEIICHIR